MSSPPEPPTIESLAQLVAQLEAQLRQASAQITSQSNSLNEAAASYQRLEAQMANRRTEEKPKKNKPNTFSGKGSILSWITHMDNYIGDATPEEALNLAISYLSGAAHEWWIMYHITDEGKEVTTWEQMKKSLTLRFDTLNKEKVARDKLARWKQIKDVPSFNDDFQKIVLDIPNISMEEQIDRYTRGLKPYIWRELCTKDYKELTEAMRDAERVEAAHRRSGNVGTSKNSNSGSNKNTSASQQPTPMEIGNIELKKLTKEERDECMKKGLCLRCRQPGHIAKNCPKGKRD